MIAAPHLSDRLALDVQSAQAMRAGARAGDPEALRAAAKQFEALVVQMMMKNMRQTSFSQDGDVLGESNSLKLYREMLDQQWAQKMTAGKGLGFAEMMVKAMESRSKAVSPEEMALLAQPEANDATGHAQGLPLVRPAEVKPIARHDFHDNKPWPVRAETQPDGMNHNWRTARQTPGIAAHAGIQPEMGASVAVSPLPIVNGEAIQAAALPEKTMRTDDPRQQFLERLRPHAEQVEAETGVPARFILAHAALETGWGRHEIRKADGAASHNLFGIKAGRGWDGEVVERETSEYQYGVPVRKVEPFRAYADYAEGFRDYAGLLTRRYQAAVRAGEDAGSFARGLAAGGYATDPNYAAKIAGVIDSVAALSG